MFVRMKSIAQTILFNISFLLQDVVFDDFSEEHINEENEAQQVLKTPVQSAYQVHNFEYLIL
jgi:hypothetical protein